MSKRSLPWLQFYPSDWLSDSVAGCCLAAQGLWLRMLFVAHNSQRSGYLESDGRAISDEQLSRRCGCATVEEYRNLLAELFAAGVPARTQEGVIYSRRMVRDQQERDSAAERQRRHRHGSVTPMSQGEVRNQKSELEVRKKKTPAAKPAPPDPRFQPFFDFAFESFEAKRGRKPLWEGKDRKGLQSLLRNQSAENLPAARLQTNWRNFLESTEPFTVKQGGSLVYFCSNIDKFSDGPILAVLQKGKTNGNDARSTASDLAMQNARALGLTDKPVN